MGEQKSTGPIRLLEHILLITKQISWVSRWRLLKKYFVKMFLGHKLSHRNNKYCCGIYFFTTFVQLCWHDAIDEWYRLLIQFVMFGGFHDKKKFCILMMLYYSSIYRLCTDFVIRVWFSYWLNNCAKFSHPSTPLATPGLLHDYKAVTSMLSKKNVMSEKTIFKILFQWIILPLNFSIGKLQ